MSPRKAIRDSTPVLCDRFANRSFPLGLLCAITFLLAGLPPIAAAAPPVNDDFASRIDLPGTLADSTSGTNVDATLEGGEPDPLGIGDGSVWWSWEAPSTGYVEINTFGSDFDSLLYVFTGATLGTLAPVAINDDAAGDFQARVNFMATMGVTYQIAVHGVDMETGSISLNVVPGVAPPANDGFSNPIDLGGSSPASTSGNNTGASLEHLGGEADPLETGGASIWWKWTAPSTDWFEVDTFGSAIDTVLYVFQGSDLATLVNLAGDDDSEGTEQARVNFQAVSGVTYRIAVHGFLGETGAVDLAVGPGVPPPSNDNFSGRIYLGKHSTVSTSGTNTGATTEAGEAGLLAASPEFAPDGGPGGASVWWFWKAKKTEIIEVNTFGSSFDTVLHVYEGNSIPALTELGANDDGGGDIQSAVTNLSVIQDQFYVAAVYGYLGETGSVTLNITSGDPPPANDDFIDAIDLGSPSSTTTTGTNEAAGIETNEPDPFDAGGASVWWRWTAPATADYEISTAGSSFDTILYIFTGNSLPTLTFVRGEDESDGTSQATVNFHATASQEYRIAVHGYFGATGDIDLSIGPGVARPANDDYADIIALPGLPSTSTAGSNAGASTEPGEPDPLATAGASVWWSWQAPNTGWVEANTALSNFDTILSVYSGNTLATLTELRSNEDSGGTDQSLVTFFATMGTVYSFSVSGDLGETGSINLNIADGQPQPPLSDFFATPDVLPAMPTSPLAATNVGASLEAGEPDPLDRGGASVWWTWTAPSTGDYEVNTFGSNLDTLLYVFSGTDITGLVPLVMGDNANGSLQSRVNFHAIIGQTYRIAVHGVQGETGTINLFVTPGVVRPLNDNFVSRTSLGNGPTGAGSGTNAGASIEPDEPDPFGFGEPSVWWTWQAPSNGYFQVDTFGSALDTILYVFSGTDLGSLVTVGVSDRAGGTNQSRVNFLATSGTSYQIAVLGHTGVTGGISVNVNPGVTPPANDAFASALDLGMTATVNTAGHNNGATFEHFAPEPDPLGSGEASVWWTWQAPGPGWVEINTLGSDFDTLLYVYTGNNLATLTTVAANDVAAGTNQSRVNFLASAGTTYRIAVLGNFGATGNISLNIGAGVVPPANDDWSSATFLGDQATGSDTGTNAGATIQYTIPEPDPLGTGGASVWWEWRPPADGYYEISTAGSDFDTVLYIFKPGAGGLANLIPVAASDDGNGLSQAAATFFAAEWATADDTIYIAVHGDKGETGIINLALAPGTTPPPNDDFASAIDLGTAPIVATAGTNAGASLEFNPVIEPDPLFSGGTSVWWRWEAPSSGYFQVDTFGSNFDTLLYVFTGPAGLGSLTVVGANDEAGGSPDSAVNFFATFGQTYYIAVHGEQGESGSILFNLGAGAVPPVNDNFAFSADLDSSPTASASGSNIGASLEFGAPEPDPLGEGGASVWWSWEAPSSGFFQVNTAGSSFDTVLYVFTGSELATLTTIGANDEAGGTQQSSVNFEATAGVTYHIAVHGDQGETGSISIQFGPGMPPPVNDDFANRINLGAPNRVDTTGSNAGAGIEPGEAALLAASPEFAPGGGPGGASVWWSWTAPGSGMVAIDTCGSDFDTVLYIFTGPDLGTLVEVAADDDGCSDSFRSRVEFPAVASQTYHIAVHGSSGDTGSVSLQISMLPPYETWIARFPTLSGADALPFADWDNDRIQNIEELAFGLDPTVDSTPSGSDPNSANLPRFVPTSTHLELHYKLNFMNLNGGVGLPIEVHGGWCLDLANFNLIVPVSLGGDNYKVSTAIEEMVHRIKYLAVLVVDPNP